MSDGTAELQKWYADRHAHIVDLVGDIAGRETFIVQGESLIRHCLETSKVDFDGRCTRKGSSALFGWSPLTCQQMDFRSCMLYLQWRNSSAICTREVAISISSFFAT